MDNIKCNNKEVWFILMTKMLVTVGPVVGYYIVVPTEVQSVT